MIETDVEPTTFLLKVPNQTRRLMVRGTLLAAEVEVNPSQPDRGITHQLIKSDDGRYVYQGGYDAYTNTLDIYDNLQHLRDAHSSYGQPLKRLIRKGATRDEGLREDARHPIIYEYVDGDQVMLVLKLPQGRDIKYCPMSSEPVMQYRGDTLDNWNPHMGRHGWAAWNTITGKLVLAHYRTKGQDESADFEDDPDWATAVTGPDDLLTALRMSPIVHWTLAYDGTPGNPPVYVVEMLERLASAVPEYESAAYGQLPPIGLEPGVQRQSSEFGGASPAPVANPVDEALNDLRQAVDVAERDNGLILVLAAGVRVIAASIEAHGPF